MSVKELASAFSCPISLENFEHPVITPCGHTFDYPFIVRHLQDQSNCPLDRKPLFKKDLRENKLVTDITSNLDKIISVWINGHQSTPYFKERCSISTRPLTEPVLLPCSHGNMNESSLVKSSIQILHSEEVFDDPCTLENLKKREWKVSCPICNKIYEPEEIIKDTSALKALRLKVQEQYPKYLEELKLFNIGLNARINSDKNDDRNLLKDKLFCPLSGKQLKNPVVASCGHTFDKSSIKSSVKCPYDKTKLKGSEVIPNFLISTYIENVETCVSSVFCGLEDEKDINGVWLYLDKSSTIKKIEKIAKELEFYTEKPKQIPLFITAKGSCPVRELIGNYDSILSENPVLQRCNSKQ